MDWFFDFIQILFVVHIIRTLWQLQEDLNKEKDYSGSLHLRVIELERQMVNRFHQSRNTE